MLRIRLTRFGRNREHQYRLVVAEHSKPVKGKYIELLGHYHPTANPKVFVAKKDRIEHWMTQGAQPSDTVASLLKKYLQMSGLDEFIAPRTKKRAPKKEDKSAAVTAPTEQPAAT